MRWRRVARPAGFVVVCNLFVGCSSAPTPAAEPVVTFRPAPAPQLAQNPGHITSQDVIAWTVRGLDEPTIIERIRHGNTVFKVSAADEIKLHDAGVTDGVVRALKSTIWD